MDARIGDVRDQDLMRNSWHFLRTLEESGGAAPATPTAAPVAARDWQPSASTPLNSAPVGVSGRVESNRSTGGGKVGTLFRRGETSIVLLVIALTALGYLAI